MWYNLMRIAHCWETTSRYKLICYHHTLELSIRVMLCIMFSFSRAWCPYANIDVLCSSSVFHHLGLVALHRAQLRLAFTKYSDCSTGKQYSRLISECKALNIQVCHIKCCMWWAVLPCMCPYENRCWEMSNRQVMGLCADAWAYGNVLYHKLTPWQPYTLP